MDLWALVLSLWASLSHSLGGDGIALLVTTGFAVALVGIWLALNAFRKTEFYKQHQVLFELADNKLADFIFLAEFGNVDLTDWQKKSDARVAAGLEYVDARMLYVIDRVQTWVNDKFGVTLDFEELLARAEHIFNEVKSDPGNGVGGNSAAS